MSESAKMPPTLRLNDTAQPCPPGTTLAELLATHGLLTDRVATAVNGTFVPRSLRQQHQLHPGDTVLTFQAIVGG